MSARLRLPDAEDHVINAIMAEVVDEAGVHGVGGSAQVWVSFDTSVGLFWRKCSSILVQAVAHR